MKKELFRNKYAKKYFEYLKENSWVSECGIDSNKMVYVAWLNGNIDRYTRREFIKEAIEFYTES